MSSRQGNVGGVVCKCPETQCNNTLFREQQCIVQKNQEAKEVEVQNRTTKETEKDQIKPMENADAMCKHITITKFNIDRTK